MAGQARDAIDSPTLTVLADRGYFEYLCPAGEGAIRRFTTVEDALTIHKYWSSACSRCALKAKWTTSENRRITRWEHEGVLESMQRRLLHVIGERKVDVVRAAIFALDDEMHHCAGSRAERAADFEQRRI